MNIKKIIIPVVGAGALLTTVLLKKKSVSDVTNFAFKFIDQIFRSNIDIVRFKKDVYLIFGHLFYLC